MKKLKISLIIFVFIIMLLLLTDVYLILLKPLDVGIEPKDEFGDIILLLGGGLKKKDEIGISTAERLQAAVKLYKKKNMRILISDGSVYKKSPAKKMFIEFLSERGVNPEHILFEGRSQTTYENFIYTKNIIIKEQSREVLVCTSPYHQKRSRNIIDHLKLSDYKLIKMEESEIYKADSIRQRIRNLKLIIREYFGILKFKLFKK